MTLHLNELKDYPKWIDAMTKEQQHDWYLWVKENFDRLKSMGAPEELEIAIKTYEHRNGLS